MGKKLEVLQISFRSHPHQHTFSSVDLEYAIEHLKNCRHRNSTKQNYRSIWKTFNNCILKLDKKPTTWESRITLYVGYLIETNKQSSTIKSYVSAICAILQIEGIELKEDKFLLTSLTKACRLINDTVKQCLPIRKGMLALLLHQLGKDLDSQPNLLILYQALFSTAYFGLLRVGKITSGSHPILAKDVQVGVNKRKILFVLHSSKTHNKANLPQMIKISSKSKNEQKDKKRLTDRDILTSIAHMLS